MYQTTHHTSKAVEGLFEDAPIMASINYTHFTENHEFSLDSSYSINSQPVEVKIYDARIQPVPASAAEELGLRGFSLVEHRSEMRDYFDPNERETVYHGEMETLCKKIFGAKHAFCMKDVVRMNDPEMKNTAKPTAAVHMDFVPDAFDMFFDQLESATTHLYFGNYVKRLILEGITADTIRSKYRIVMVNTWRNIDVQPLVDHPLVVCDKRTVNLGDAFVSKMHFPDYSIRTARLPHDPAHSWHYYPRMKTDELLVFVTFDSGAEMWGTVHSSFKDPSTPPSAPRRKSLETRTLCLLPKDLNSEYTASAAISDRFFARIKVR